jgi:hypothetical protein
MKCKALRIRSAATKLRGVGIPEIGTLEALEGARWSKIYRNLYRDGVDSGMPGPPSYFTRRRDGIPVPSLSKFMAGYAKIFKLKLSSKTLENSYLVMNRQIWTNIKQFYSTAGGEEQSRPECTLCGMPETTTHFMFECEEYSEPLWTKLESIINEMLAVNALGDNLHIRLHAYNIMYNTMIVMSMCYDMSYDTVTVRQCNPKNMKIIIL